MFWMVIGMCAAVAAVLVLWVNASAFGVVEKDHMPVSEYEKRLGLGAHAAEKQDGEGGGGGRSENV